MTNRKAKFLRLLIILITALSIVSCATTRRIFNFDTNAELKLSAQANINPSSENKPSPLVLQVFKLRDARQFKQEDFINLFEDANGRLGNDLIEEVTKLKEIAPGEKRLEKFALTPEVKYIGILGEYIQYNSAVTKAVIKIEPHTTTKSTLKIEKLKIHFEKD